MNCGLPGAITGAQNKSSAEEGRAKRGAQTSFVHVPSIPGLRCATCKLCGPFFLLLFWFCEPTHFLIAWASVNHVFCHLQPRTSNYYTSTRTEITLCSSCLLVSSPRGCHLLEVRVHESYSTCIPSTQQST